MAPMNAVLAKLALSIVGGGTVVALDNGLGRTPPMGFNVRRPMVPPVSQIV